MVNKTQGGGRERERERGLKRKRKRAEKREEKEKARGRKMEGGSSIDMYNNDVGKKSAINL